MTESIPVNGGFFGFSGAAASLPELKVEQLLELILEVFSGKKTTRQAAEEAAMPYKTWAEVFVKEQAANMLDDALKQADLEQLTQQDFSQRLVKESLRIGKLVHSYMRHEIDEETLVKELGSKSLRKLTQDYLSALDIPEKLGVNSFDEIFQLPPSTLAYRAFLAAFQIWQGVENDLAVAHAQRLEIERACAESITRIRAYRAEMDRIVSQYLTVRLKTFESAFAAMDRALLEGDSDGYIRGNVEIQKILKYDAQFTTQAEFDDLMASDEAFRL